MHVLKNAINKIGVGGKSCQREENEDNPNNGNFIQEGDKL